MVKAEGSLRRTRASIGASPPQPAPCEQVRSGFDFHGLRTQHIHHDLEFTRVSHFDQRHARLHHSLALLVDTKHTPANRGSQRECIRRVWGLHIEAIAARAMLSSLLATRSPNCAAASSPRQPAADTRSDSGPASRFPGSGVQRAQTVGLVACEGEGSLGPLHGYLGSFEIRLGHRRACHGFQWFSTEKSGSHRGDLARRHLPAPRLQPRARCAQGCRSQGLKPRSAPLSGSCPIRRR